MDQLQQMLQEEASRRGVTLDQATLQDMGKEFVNFQNQARLAKGPLQPGQAERVQRLQGVPQDQEPTLASGLKSVGQAGLDMVKGIPQVVGDVGKMAALGLAQDEDERTVAKGRFDEGAKDLGNIAKGAVMAPVNFVKGLGREIQSPETTTQQDVASTVGAGVGTLADIGMVKGGLGRGRGTAQARAAGLVDQLKGPELPTPLDPNAAPSGPANISITPNFEEDLGPLTGAGSRGGPLASILRAAKSGVPKGIEESGAQAYPPTGVHPELQALYDEVLAPSRGGAPEEGAGFQSAASAKAKRAGKSGVRRSERYRNTFDSSGEGQPE